MYEAHFGLTEKPFSLTPNPRFLYLSRTHEEALAHLRYGLENRVGFIAVTGEVGTGKTTILRTLFAALDERRFRLALIFNPCMTPSGLMSAILKEFGLPPRKCSLQGLVDIFNSFLLEENRRGRIPVLVIDEAQNLDAEVLEQIRLLSNLETESDKLIQIVLVGQPELDDLLNRHELRQLAQRIVVRCHLTPLDQAETGAYVRHRLQVAGVFGRMFDDASIASVYRWTRGLPRLINVLSDRVLLCTYVRGGHDVTASDVRQAILELDCPGRRTSGPKKVMGRLFSGSRRFWLTGLATITGVFVLAWLSRFLF